jgi:hypothetical protein
MNEDKDEDDTGILLGGSVSTKRDEIGIPLGGSVDTNTGILLGGSVIDTPKGVVDPISPNRAMLDSSSPQRESKDQIPASPNRALLTNRPPDAEAMPKFPSAGTATSARTAIVDDNDATPDLSNQSSVNNQTTLPKIHGENVHDPPRNDEKPSTQTGETDDDVHDDDSIRHDHQRNSSPGSLPVISPKTYDFNHNIILQKRASGPGADTAGQTVPQLGAATSAATSAPQGNAGQLGASAQHEERFLQQCVRIGPLEANISVHRGALAGLYPRQTSSFVNKDSGKASQFTLPPPDKTPSFPLLLKHAPYVTTQYISNKIAEAQAFLVRSESNR